MHSLSTTYDEKENRATTIPSNGTPQERGSCLSAITFSWMSPLFTTGYKRALQMEDLIYLRGRDHASELLKKFNQSYKIQKKNTQNIADPSVWKTLWRAFGKTMWFALPFNFIYQIFQFAGPVILSMFLDSTNIKESYILATALFLVYCFQTFFLQQYFLRTCTVGMQSRVALIAAIYEKSLKLTMSARGERTSGEIVNLITSDCRKLRDIFQTFWTLLIAPLQIIVAVYLLYQEVSWSVFVGVGSQLLVLTPLQVYIGNKLREIQKRLMKKKDSRLKMINELFGSMKIVKMYAWEQPFHDHINMIRNSELSLLKKFTYISFTMALSFLFTPVIVTAATFASYTLLDGKTLTASKAFTSIALFNILRFPLMMLPATIAGMIEASVSVKRIGKFLNAQEIDTGIIEYTTNMNPSNSNKKNAISIRNCQFAWDDQMNIIALSNINIDFKSGDITMIIGETGSGKSTLLAAMLGQINKIDGSLMYYESPFRPSDHITVAFTSQVAWIQNDTVRENILFGNVYNHNWYYTICSACALLDDFNQFANGDLTEIGEKGINLSGGQKQRIALARAVYSNADVYLFDDPLSAVDPHVGNHIFNKCFVNLLKNNAKTVIFSTHAISFLKLADKIIVMENGTVKTKGKLKDLINADINITKYIIQTNKQNDTDNDIDNKDEFDADNLPPLKFDEKKDKEDDEKKLDRKRRRSSAGFKLPTTLQQIEMDKKIKEEQKNDDDDDGLNTQLGILTKSEVRAEGAVGWTVYKSYLNAAGGAPLIFGTVLTMVIFQIFYSGSNFWLGFWADNEFNRSVEFYILWYLAIQGLSMLMTFMHLVITVIGRIRASTTLHERLLSRCIRAPMSFFDTTPIGRIINRFSKDMNNADETVPDGMGQYLRMSSFLIGLVLSVMVVAWYFTIIFIPMLYIFWKLQKYFISTARELRRLESLMNSPIYSQFAATLDGVNIITAFKKENNFSYHNKILIDNGSNTYYPTIIGNRWLAIRIQSINNILIGVAAYSICLIQPSPGLAGVALASVMSLMGGLSFWVRIKAQVEQDVISIERIGQYSEIKQEADFIINNNRPPKDWPKNGKIEFNNVFMKYRRNLNYVLNGLTVTINGAEKVGVIGRTGAGKSSLFVTLLRMCEIDTIRHSGNILIDNIDVSSIGLFDLRSKISVIPQDPILFIGTVRSNIDPFKNHTDNELIDALKLSHVYTGLRKMAIEADMKRELRELRKAKRKAKAEKGNKHIIDMKRMTSTSITADTDAVHLPMHKQHKHIKMKKVLKTIKNKPQLKYVTTATNAIATNAIKSISYTDSDRESSSSRSSTWSLTGESSLHAVDYMDDPKYSDLNPLDIIVEENGSNFSVGQRQLICLSRAIVRKSKILLLDEATSSVDHNTDYLIQKTIRKVFRNNTILTIAHRIDTILDYDKILILDSGKILEFDTPNNLLNDNQSKFTEIVKESFGVNVKDVINQKNFYNDPPVTPKATNRNDTTHSDDNNSEKDAFIKVDIEKEEKP